MGKVSNPLILPIIGSIEMLQSFYKNGFGIRRHTKVDMPLNKESKSNQSKPKITQSAEAVEYTDCFFAEGCDPTH